MLASRCRVPPRLLWVCRTLFITIKIDISGSAGNRRGSPNTGTAGSCSSGVPAARLTCAGINPPPSHLRRRRWKFVLDALSGMRPVPRRKSIAVCSRVVIVFVVSEGGSLERLRKRRGGREENQVPARKNISNNQAPSHGTADKLALLILTS